MKIRTADGRGTIKIDADIIRSELGFTSFYKKRTITLRREAMVQGFWPFKRTIPACDEKTTRDEWVLSFATHLIVEMSPEDEKEQGTNA